jgi:hypothetical protein
MSLPGSPQPLRRADLGLAGLLLLLAAGLYWSTRQEWLWNDGFGLVARLAWSPEAIWPHPGYLPTVRALGWLWPTSWPYAALLAASWLPGAALVAGLYLLARTRLERGPAALLCLALMLSPLLWFFATTIEVHALHGAAVALGLGLLLVLPWRSPRLALALAALCFVPAAATHLMAVLLIPGWLALSLWLAQTQGPGVRRAPFAGLLAALFTIELLVLWNSDADWWRASDWPAGTQAGALAPLHALSGIWAQIQRDAQPLRLAWLKEDLLSPLGWVYGPLLWLLVLAGMARACGRGVAGASTRPWLWLVLPLLVVTAVWGVPNRGGYLMGVLPGLLVLAAQGYAELSARTRWLPALAPLCLLSSGWPAHGEVLAWRETYDQEDRQERARAAAEALGGRGLLVSLDPRHQPIGFDQAGILEFQAAEQFIDGFQAGLSPEPLAERISSEIEHLYGTGFDSVAIDARWFGTAVPPELEAYVRAFNHALRARFELRPIASPTWPLLRIEGLRPEQTSAVQSASSPKR